VHRIELPVKKRIRIKLGAGKVGRLPAPWGRAGPVLPYIGPDPK